MSAETHRDASKGSFRGQCVLVRKELAARLPERVMVLAIHGHGGDCDQLAPLCAGLGPDICAVLPQAWRSLSIHGMVEPVHPGYSWYYDFAHDKPEPATFGDCLIELEALVYDLFQEDERRRIVVLGYEQGATLALTLAGVVPEFLAGVIAVGGCVPRIRSWSPPVQSLRALPILMISDPESTPQQAELTEDSVRRLSDTGARVELQSIRGSLRDPLAVANLTRQWLRGRTQDTSQ